MKCKYHQISTPGLHNPSMKDGWCLTLCESLPSQTWQASNSQLLGHLTTSSRPPAACRQPKVLPHYNWIRCRSLAKVSVTQGEPRPSLPAGFPVKKNAIGPFFHFKNPKSGWKPLKSLNLGLLKHIIKVDPSINLLHCRIHLGQKSFKILKRLINVCQLHVSLSQFVTNLAQKPNSHLLPPSRHFRRHFPPETNTTVKFCVFDPLGD